MAAQQVASINCPNCRSPFTAPVQQIVDAQANPEAKIILVSGRLNSIVCPHCGLRASLNAPFLYHDAELEIAFVCMPMDLQMTNVEQQRIVGDLTKSVMNWLPPEARKGYLLQPQTFLTQQSLIDAVLEKDDELRELVEVQQRKMELLDQLREIDPQDSLAVAEFIGANDEDLDETFFQLLSVVISVSEGQEESLNRERLMQHHDKLLEKTSTGKVIKAQQAAVAALADNPTRETLIEQLIAAQDRRVRGALLMTGRQLLDYPFFQSLTARIDRAGSQGDTETKETLTALRKEILEIRDELDALAQAQLEARAGLLRDLLLAEDPREVALRRLPEIDTTFFSVLSANIQQAMHEEQEDAVLQLRRIGDVIMELLNEMAPPEVRLINNLVGAEDEEEVRRLLEEGREYVNDNLLQMVDQTIQDLEAGRRQQGVDRLRNARDHIEDLIATG